MKDKFCTFLVIAFPLVVIGTILWQVPQEWKACTVLYDNTPAQIICFLK